MACFLGAPMGGDFFQDVLVLNNVGKGTIAHIYPALSMCQQALYKKQTL